MRKIRVEKEIICPFAKCRYAYSMDKNGNDVYKDMDARCESCKDSYEKNEHIIGNVIECPENSVDYKDYEKMYVNMGM